MFGLNFGSLLCLWLGHVPDPFTIEVSPRTGVHALCKNCDHAIRRTYPKENGPAVWVRVVALPPSDSFPSGQQVPH